MAFELPPDHIPLAWNEPINLGRQYWDKHIGFIEYVRSIGAVVVETVSRDEQPWVDGDYPSRFELGEGEDRVEISYKMPTHAQYRLGTFALLEEPLVFIPSGPETFELDVAYARQRDRVARQYIGLRETADPDKMAAASEMFEGFKTERAAYLAQRSIVEASYNV